MIADLEPYPAMKDSGVPWLGEVPEHWNVKRLAQIGRFLKGNGGTKEDEVSAGVPCVRYGDLYTTHTFFILQSRSYIASGRESDYTAIRYGDVLFAASGETIDEIGKSAVNLIPSAAYCGGDVVLFRSATEVNARFMGYATDCPSAAVQKATMGRGTTVKHIYSDQLKRLAVALPPPAEQAAIVRFLDHADRRIRRYIRVKQKLIKLLEEQKQAIIHRAVTRGLDPNVGLKPSGIAWIEDVPQHWDVQRLGRAIRLLTGFPFASAGFTQEENGVRLLRGINVTPSRVRWDAVVRWGRKPADGLDAFALRVGDIVLGMDRPIIGSGVRAATIEEKDTPSLLLQRVARLRPTPRLDARFLLLLLRGRLFADYIAPIFTGISVPHLSPEQISGFHVTLPPLREQQAIVSYIESATASLRVAATRSEREIELLREFGTRLIADVVTGKLDVRAAAASLHDEVDEPEPSADTDALEEGDEDFVDGNLDAAPDEAEV